MSDNSDGKTDGTDEAVETNRSGLSISRRSVLAGVGLAGAGSASMFSFANAAGSTSSNVGVTVNGGGVNQVKATNDLSASPNWDEVVTENGGGITGLANDKDPQFATDRDGSTGGDPTDKYLFAAAIENPEEIDQLLDFQVNIANAGTIAGGRPYNYLSFDLRLEQFLAEVDASVSPNKLSFKGNVSTGGGFGSANKAIDGDVVDTADPSLNSNVAKYFANDVRSGSVTADNAPLALDVSEGDSDHIETAPEVPLSLNNPVQTLRADTDNLGDISTLNTGDNYTNYGFYRIAVVGGTGTVRDLSGTDDTHNVDTDFTVDFGFNVS